MEASVQPTPPPIVFLWSDSDHKHLMKMAVETDSTKHQFMSHLWGVGRNSCWLPAMLMMDDQPLKVEAGRKLPCLSAVFIFQKQSIGAMEVYTEESHLLNERKYDYE